MTGLRQRNGFALACLVLTALSAAAAAAQSGGEAEILERLRRLEARQAELERQLAEMEISLRELEAELAILRAGAAPETTEAASPEPEPAPPSAESTGAQEPAAPATVEAQPPAGAVAPAPDDPSPFGEFTPGKGFTVARTEYGELNLSVYTYLRYLNQGGLDETYVDHFGATREIDVRNDLQINKVFLYTKGWFLDPKLRYVLYAWGSNTALGQTSNVLLAGNLRYSFSPAFSLTGGVVGLPSTRSLMGQFPNWHRVDSRLVADELMRGSFTQGLSADGRIAEGLYYNVTVGNNLSNFGVDAGELDDRLDTFGGALVWMPTTGEFGPNASFGDYEDHADIATLFGLHATASTEDKQSQPGLNEPENTQIRLSDGALVFLPNVFAPGVTVNQLDYRMFAANAGLKHRGFALEGEVYYRTLGDFRTDQPVSLDRVVDKGFQLTASAMLVPRTVQAYLNGSRVLGEYGDPWDAGLGLNWWPFRKRGFRLNSELMYLRDSPTGNASAPYPVGADGWIFVTHAEVAF